MARADVRFTACRTSMFPIMLLIGLPRAGRFELNETRSTEDTGKQCSWGQGREGNSQRVCKPLHKGFILNCGALPNIPHTPLHTLALIYFGSNKYFAVFQIFSTADIPQPVCQSAGVNNLLMFFHFKRLHKIL